MPQAFHRVRVCAPRAGPLRCPGWIGRLIRHTFHGGHMRVRRAVIGTASALALVVGGIAAAHVAGASQGRTVREGFGPRRPNVQASCSRSTQPGAAACFALRRTDFAPRTALAPDAAPAGYGPADLRGAYRLPDGGAGVTVAIVDAFDD